MAWERGYYYRVRKIGGRVSREYCGNGTRGALAAQQDATERERRETERVAVQAARGELASLEASLNRLNQAADLLTRAVLLAAGYHQHKRGSWRKRRGQDTFAG